MDVFRVGRFWSLSVVHRHCRDAATLEPGVSQVRRLAGVQRVLRPWPGSISESDRDGLVSERGSDRLLDVVAKIEPHGPNWPAADRGFFVRIGHLLHAHA